MSNGGGNINEHGHVLAELERLKRDNSFLRMRLTYLEAENNHTGTSHAATGGKTVKLSKWHRVKGALGWEKDKEDMLKVPNSSSDSPFSVSPSGSCLSHSSLGTHYALPVMPHLSSSSSDEELHVQERRCVSASDADCKGCNLEEMVEVPGRSKSLDSETPSKLELHLIANKKNMKVSKDDSQPHHRTPWSKMKCMIHHHSRVGSRKRISCCNQCEKKVEKWQTLSEEGNIEAEEECMIVKDPTPKLTVTLPSSEELNHEKNEKKQEISDTPVNHSEISPPLNRKSKWLKVRDVFLQGSRSAPTSPVRSESFAYDLESDEVSSGEVLGEKDDEVFDDNENLRYEIEASYIELQNRLTEEFTRKMEEIAHNSDIKHRFRLKKTSDSNKSVPQEVIVPTSTGLFRFEGISDKFTRRLYEWEVARGIAPEESTFALLDPQYKPLPKKSKNNLVEYSNGIVKSKSIGSLVDIGNSNQDVLAHQRTSSLSLNDVDMQSSRIQEVPEPKGENEPVTDSIGNRNLPPFKCTSEDAEQRLIDSYNSIVSSDCENAIRNTVSCRQVVDSSYQLLQENISLLDKLKKERDVCRQLEDDMIHLEGQIHNVSKSFEHGLVEKIELQGNADEINLHSYEFATDYQIGGRHIDINIHNDQVHQLNPIISPNMDLKLDHFKVENNLFHAEPLRTKYDNFYNHNMNSFPANRIDSILIHNLVIELIDIAERLESAVVERDKEIFHLKSELYRKEMAALHGNEIRNYFSSFTLPIHRLRSRRSEELSTLPKQIMEKLLELKQALTLASSASHLNLSTPGNIGQPVLSPHTLRRCAGHEDLSPEPPVQPRSVASSPASSFSFHGSYNADESPNEWMSISAHNQNASHDIINSSDWMGIREEHSSFTDYASEDGGSEIGSLMSATNVFVPTTRKIFSPVGDSKVIEYVIGEECSDNKKKPMETDTIQEEEENITEDEEMSETADGTIEEEEEPATNSIGMALPEDKSCISSVPCQNLVFMECPIENNDVGIQELILGEELSCSLKMRAMKIQRAKEEFLRGTRSESLSIVVDRLESDLPTTLLVKSASATAVTTVQPLCTEEPNNSTKTSSDSAESQTKNSKSSLLGIFKRPKRKCKEGAIATLARQSLTLPCEIVDSSQTKSCPSSPVLLKRNDSSWMKNPAKMIFRPKGKYMINNK